MFHPRDDKAILWHLMHKKKVVRTLCYVAVSRYLGFDLDPPGGSSTSVPDVDLHIAASIERDLRKNAYWSHVVRHPVKQPKSVDGVRRALWRVNECVRSYFEKLNVRNIRLNNDVFRLFIEKRPLSLGQKLLFWRDPLR